MDRQRRPGLPLDRRLQVLRHLLPRRVRRAGDAGRRLPAFRQRRLQLERARPGQRLLTPLEDCGGDGLARVGLLERGVVNQRVARPEVHRVEVQTHGLAVLGGDGADAVALPVAADGGEDVGGEVPGLRRAHKGELQHDGLVVVACEGLGPHRRQVEAPWRHRHILLHTNGVAVVALVGAGVNEMERGLPRPRGRLDLEHTLRHAAAILSPARGQALVGDLLEGGVLEEFLLGDGGEHEAQAEQDGTRADGSSWHVKSSGGVRQ